MRVLTKEKLLLEVAPPFYFAIFIAIHFFSISIDYLWVSISGAAVFLFYVWRLDYVTRDKILNIRTGWRFIALFLFCSLVALAPHFSFFDSAEIYAKYTVFLGGLIVFCYFNFIVAPYDSEGG